MRPCHTTSTGTLSHRSRSTTATATRSTQLRRGRKTGHWIWWIFPQIEGLGETETTRYYAIVSLDEARAYFAHPVLGARLLECARALLATEGLTVDDIFDHPDDAEAVLLHDPVHARRAGRAAVRAGARPLLRRQCRIMTDGRHPRPGGIRPGSRRGPVATLAGHGNESMDPSILAAVLILWVGAMFWLFAPSFKEQPILAALPMLACILLPPLGLLLLVIAIPGRWDDYRRGSAARPGGPNTTPTSGTSTSSQSHQPPQLGGTEASREVQADAIDHLVEQVLLGGQDVPDALLDGASAGVA